MTHRIVGEWDLAEVSKAQRGKGVPLGRIVFLEQDGQLFVKYAEAAATERPSRVEVAGETLRFEILAGRSARGNTNYVYEIGMHGSDSFGGTRRQGLLSRTPITGQRVEAPVAAAPHYAAGDLATSLIAMPGSVAEAKARAAEAAERAALAAAEAAAMQAEAEAAAALEAARRAAENAAAARAAIQTQSLAPEAFPPVPPPVTAPSPNAVAAPSPLASLPAPTQPPQPWPVEYPPAPVEYAAAPVQYAPTPVEYPPAPVAYAPAPAEYLAAAPAVPVPAPAPTPEPAGAVGRREVRITHRLSREGRSTLAAEVFPGVFVWGDALVTTESRLRQFGWELTPIATDATIDVDDALIEHAVMVRDSFSI